MEEVIEICKDQIQSFDSINRMSQQVIERLERQVGEYKFELSQAKDTIER
jgi:prefoldin subunit 5